MFPVALSQETLSEILNDFNNLVDKQGYKRLPYKDWRTLWGLSRKVNYPNVQVKTSSYTGEIVIEQTDVHQDLHGDFITTTNWVWKGNFDEVNTFGHYLYECMAPNGRHSPVKTGTLTGALTVTQPGITVDSRYYTCADSPAVSTYATISSYNDIDRRIKKLENNNEDKNKEKEDMNTNKFMNFEFGPIRESSIRMSLYGLAVKNVSGTWVSYDASTRSIMDVDILNFNGRQFMYKVPVAINAVAVGDIVIHARKPMFVTEIRANSLMAIDPVDGEYKEIVLTKSPFGFNFVTKVMNLMGSFMNTPASAESPFGNMWMMMAAVNDENTDVDPMMMMLMMSLTMSANSGASLNGINPAMLYAMMSGKKGDDKSEMFKWMIMSQMLTGSFAGLTPATEHKCSCGGNCENHNN